MRTIPVRYVPYRRMWYYNAKKKIHDFFLLMKHSKPERICQGSKRGGKEILPHSPSSPSQGCLPLTLVAKETAAGTVPTVSLGVPPTQCLAARIL